MRSLAKQRIRRNRLLLAGGILVLVAMLVFLLFKPENPYRDKTQVEEAINHYLAVRIAEQSQFGAGDRVLIEQLNQRYTLQVIETQGNRRNPVAICRVTAPDMTTAFNQVFQRNQGREIYYVELREQVLQAAQDAPLTQMDVIVPLYLLEDQVLPELNEALVDALYGGLFSYTYDFLAQIETPGEITK